MITRELRHAIARAMAVAGLQENRDPGLRPTGTPGQYASSVALGRGPNPRETAGTLAAILASEQWIARAAVTGPGYVTVTVTPEALNAVADSITRAGPACVKSDALAGQTVFAAPEGDPLTPDAGKDDTWEEARAALAARLTVRLAAAAGATVAELASPERLRLTHQAHRVSSHPPRPPAGPVAQAQTSSDRGDRESRIRSEDPKAEPGANPLVSAGSGEAARQIPEPGVPPPPYMPPYMSGAPRRDIYGNFMTRDPGSEPLATGPRETVIARAVAFAGRDAVLFTLARAIPGKPLRVDPQIIARHVPGNPAYAVRYAHARAASGVRWAIASSAADTIRSGGGAPRSPLADPRSELVVPAAGADKMAVFAIGPGPRDTGGYGGASPREAAVLLDVLSWLPERVATAARRGRPDEFARYLEDLASVTVDVLSSASHAGSAPGRNSAPGNSWAPGSDKLTLAMAARTGLAAGLGLLEIEAPDRL